ncbi:MAG: hypothetical protein RTU92_12435 [Candidatus Thorarchaeota archaeon]
MSKAKKASTIQQFRCQSCNAPYPLGADDVIATCPYCGFTFMVDGKEMKDHLLIPNKLDVKGVKSAVKKWLTYASKKSVGSGIMKDVEIDDPNLQWIPVFMVESDCKVYHLGGEKIERGDTKLWRKIERSSAESVTEWILARRHAATFGIQEFITSLATVSTKKFKISDTDSAPVLNSEIGEDDSVPRARSRKTDRDRAELEEELDALYDYRLDMTVKDVSYVHSPYWLVRYNYKGGTFRVAVSGATGDVLLGELPVTKRYRIVKWFSSAMMLTLAAAIIQATPYVTLLLLGGSSSDEGELFMVPVIMAIAGILLWLGSYTVFGGVLNYEICLTADAEERDTRFSMTGSIERLMGRFT